MKSKVKTDSYKRKVDETNNDSEDFSIIRLKMRSGRSL